MPNYPKRGQRMAKSKAATGYKKGGAVAFKPCKGCPTPAKCKKAGKCLAKASKKK
jgi:hypothetical protein